VATVDDALARAGLARTGPARWMRRWPLSAVLRVPVGASAVWFKAVPPLFAHEGRVARWVADACPGATPRVLGAGDGWLIADEMPRARTAPRGHVMSTLARVQLASVGGTDELLALGCPARGLDRLLADVDELLRRPDLLPAAT